MSALNSSTGNEPRHLLPWWILAAMLTATLAAAAAGGGPDDLDLSLSLRTEHGFFRVEVASGRTASRPAGVAESAGNGR